VELKAVELFRVGRWNDVKTFQRSDLDAMAESFVALQLAGRTPLKFGHNDEQPMTDGQPALGWLSRVWRDGDVLRGDFSDVPQVVYQAIKQGSYKFVSVELLRDVVSGDREYPWVLSAVALLGADIPAVAGLGDLQQLTMARRARFASGTRMTFTTGGRDTMTDEKQAEIDRLNGLLLQQAQDFAITSGRCVPAERERFNRRYGDKGTVAEWNDWLRDSPRPLQIYSQQRPHGRSNDDRDSMQDGERPDSKLVALAQKEVEKSNGQLTYFAAQQKVLRANPELAEAYRHMPGNKE